jgi:hypothetical protein
VFVVGVFNWFAHRRAGTEPILFLICLVDAVFSDNVWMWAHERFTEYLRRRKEQKEQGDVGKRMAHQDQRGTRNDTGAEGDETRDEAGQAGGDTAP